MKFKLPVLALAILLISACAEKLHRSGSSAKNLKVLTYNIHHANPPSKKDLIDIDAIVRVIKKEDPDLIAMQELDKLTIRSGKMDQAKIIAEKTGMHYAFFKAIDYEGGEYGIAIFSKRPFKDPKQIILPKEKESEETRTLAYVEIDYPGRGKITFACTHLTVAGENSRVLQIKAICNELGKLSNPVIFCGDLNSVVGSPSISLLLEQFRNTCSDNCGFTVPVINPRRNIDFILTKNANWPVKDYHVVDETYASDHRPVAATFVMEP